MNEPLLLILDLDETLIHSTESSLGREPDFTAGQYMVYQRPGARSFIREMAELFTLAVWSSGSSDYVSILVDKLFGKTSPAFVWARERCTRKVDPETGEYHWLKNLMKVKRRGFSLSRVLVVEDSPEKLKQSYGNLILVTPFLGDPGDDELPLLAKYLSLLRSCENVRRVDKRSWRSGID